MLHSCAISTSSFTDAAVGDGVADCGDVENDRASAAFVKLPYLTDRGTPFIAWHWTLDGDQRKPYI
jgi:hypothetical protein